MKLTATMVCDLCHRQPPSLYCSSDSAFLCSHCDSQVHTANFLVARHIRFPICSLCKSYHSNNSRSCDDDDDHDNDDASSSSSSTVCNSYNKTTTATAAGVVVSSSSSDWKTRDVLVDWCTRLGGGGGGVIEVARQAFQVWWHQDPDRRWVGPYRVGLAASLWVGLLRFTKDDGNKRMRMRSLLKRLEEISGVPAKSIVVAQSKLAGTLRTMKHRRQGKQRHDAAVEESWAEC